MMSCACSAGPAFEGGDISCGMRATDGAIEACSIDAKTMEPTLHIVGNEGQKPVGLCGSGIIDVIAELFRCGIISPKGKIHPWKETVSVMITMESEVMYWHLRKKQQDIRM